MRSRYKAEHVNLEKSLRNEVRTVSGRTGRLFLSLALACLLFPASSLASDAVSSSGDEAARDTASDVQSGEAPSTSQDGLTADVSENDSLNSGEGAGSTDGGIDSGEGASEADSQQDGEGSEDSTDVSEGSQQAGNASEIRSPKKAPLDSNSDDGVSIDIAVKKDAETLNPYSESDTSIYSTDSVTLEVTVDELSVDDNVTIEGTDDYREGWTVASRVIADGDEGELKDSITVSDSSSGTVSVKVTRGDDVIAQKSFSNDIVIDAVPPKVENFKLSYVSGGSAENAAIVSERPVSGSGDSKSLKYFNLDKDGTARQLEISATVEDDNLADKVFALRDIDGNDAFSSDSRIKSAWTESESGTNKFDFKLTLQANDFLTATSNAVKALQASISVSDKAGNETNNQYPKAVSRASGSEVDFTGTDYFSAENALLADVTATPSFKDASPASKSGDSAYYFQKPANAESIELESIEFGNTGNVSFKKSAESSDFVLSANGEDYLLGESMDDGKLTVSGVGFAPVPNEVKRYDGTSVKVTSEYGATRTIPIDDVVVSDISPSASLALNSSELSHQEATVGEGEDASGDEWIYGSGVKPKLTIALTGTSVLTGKNDVVVTFLGDNGETVEVVGGETSSADKQITWDADDDTENGTWTGTYEVNTSSDGTTPFKENVAYRVKSVTAKTVFDSDGPSVNANKDNEGKPVLFLVDTASPIITINLEGAKLTNPSEDGSPLVSVIVSKILSGGTITATVIDKSMNTNGDDSTVTLTTADGETKTEFAAGKTWSVSKDEEGEPIADTYVFTIPYDHEGLIDGSMKLKVHAEDLAGNSTDFSYAGDDLVSKNETRVNGEKFKEGWQSTFSVDNTSVELVGLTFWQDKDCETEATPDETDSEGIAYFDRETVFAKLSVKDANFAPKNSKVVTYQKNVVDSRINSESVEWKHDSEPDADGKWTWYTVLEIPAGDDYSFAVTANDLAGNATSNFKDADISSNHFSVDYSFPNVSVVASGATWVSAAYNEIGTDMFADDVTITATVEDSTLASDPDLSFTLKSADSTWMYVPSGEESWKPVDGKTGQYEYKVDLTPDVLKGDNAAAYLLEVTAKDFQGHTTVFAYGDNGTYTPESGVQVRRGGKLNTSIEATSDSELEATSSKQFLLDKSAPSVDVAIDRACVNPSKSSGHSGIDYYDGAITATITVTDEHFVSDCAEVSLSGEKLNPQPTWTPDAQTNTWTASLEIEDESPADSSYTLTVLAPDLIYVSDGGEHSLGHQTEYQYGANSEATAANAGACSTKANGEKVRGSSFVIDKTSPTVEVSYNRALVGSENGVGYFTFVDDDADSADEKDKITATVVVSDNHFDETTAIDPSNGSNKKSSEGKTWTRVLPPEGDVAQWKAEVEFNETKADENASLGTIEVKDLAARVVESSYASFVYDVTSPVVEIDYGGATPKSNDGEGDNKVDYYAGSVTATVTVTDRNFESESTQSVITKVGNVQEISGWTQDANNNEKWTAVVKFDENNQEASLSDISVVAVDKIYSLADSAEKSNVEANHKAELAYSDNEGSGARHFVVDATKPNVSIEFDKTPNVSKDVEYYDGAVVATITVTDRNYSKDGNKNIDDGTVVCDAKGKPLTLDQDEWTPNPSQADPGAEVSWTNKVTFNAEEPQKISVSAVDKAGLVGSAESRQFIIDMTDPTVAIAIDKPKQDTDASGVDYYGGSLTATVKVVDVNFDADGSKISIDGGKPGKASWNPSKDGTTWQTTIDYSEGNQHRLTVLAKDLAKRSTGAKYGDSSGYNGSESVLGTTDSEGSKVTGSSFTVDLTKPVISYKVNQVKSATHNSVDYFSNIASKDDEAVITVTVEDVNFNSGSELNVITKNGTDYKDAKWKKKNSTTWTTTVAFGEGAGNLLDVTLVDWAKHKSSLRYGKSTVDGNNDELASPTFTVDLTAPSVDSASVNTDYSGNYGDDYYFFDRKTRLTVNVTDNIGLRSVQLVDKDGHYGKSCYVASDVKAGAKKQVVNVDFDEGFEFDRDITIETIDLAYNSRTWSIAPNGDVSDVTGSSRKNAAFFEDSHPQSLVLDLTNPKLEFNGVSAGAYYNSTQYATLNVDELNFRYLKSYDVDADKTLLTVDKRPGSADGAGRQWTVPVSSFDPVNEGQSPSGLDGLYRHTEKFDGDGHYTLTASLVDPAGRKSSARQGEFTIDFTRPEITVTWDNNDAMNGSYYAAGRTATVVITEHNFDASLINVDSTGSVGSWVNNGDTHTMTIDYQSDGTYDLTISGRDLAGNELETYASGEFVIDMTAPTITFGGVEDGGAYNSMVMPTVTFADEANFDSNGTQYTLSGTKNGDVSYSVSNEGGDNSSTVNYADFGYEQSSEQYDSGYDDIYTIQASMVDLAGNSAEESITFSVNRYGSNFRVLNQQEYARNDGYLDQRREIQVQEVNVSGCDSEKHGVTVTSGTNVKNLELHESAQSTGYTIESDTSDDGNTRGWSSYVYHVAADNFDKDGSYHVSVNSDDRAENKNTSSSYYDRDDSEGDADAEVSFVLDETDPIITNLNVSSGSVYDDETYQASFGVVENIGVKSVQVALDGKDIEAQPDSYGNYSFSIPSESFTDRTLDIKVRDLANREANEIISGFHVTTDPFELHLPFVIGGAVLGLAVIGGVGFAIFRIRRASL